MKLALALICSLCAVLPALAEPQVEAGDPLGPCLKGAPPPDGIEQPGAPWGVEIASSFDKKQALDEFDRAQKDYPAILGAFSPTVVAVCDLSMGTDLRYAVRVVFDDRDAADKLCAKLQAAGGDCIVLKN